MRAGAWRTRLRWALPLSCAALGGVGVTVAKQKQAPLDTGISESLPRPNEDVPHRPAGQGQVDLFEAVGNTPLIELKGLSKLTGCRILAKAEFMNPCGSIKDRAAKYLILDAEKRGELQPGGTIIEATGGNTGVSMALLAAARGYQVIFTMPEKTAPEKIELMRILGAQVHVQPLVSMMDREQHFYHVSHRIYGDASRNGVSCAYPNQFENTANMRAHYETTGPEIWTQTGGRIDGFVTGSGTGGTISGCSKFLKEKDPSIAVWVVDPYEVAGLSTYINSGRSNSKWVNEFEMLPTQSGSTIAEGVGLPRITPNLRHAVIDRGVTCANQEIVDMAYFLLRHDGVFVGPSAAMNAVGAVKMARELGPGHTIVTVLCDGGERYRSKLYNHEWLAERDLLPSVKAIDIKTPSLEFVEPL